MRQAFARPVDSAAGARLTRPGAARLLPDVPVSQEPVIIIGAGLSGLAAAVTLQAAGRRALVLEAGEEVGGRVVTREVDGFLVDRGFQVLLDSYPTVNELLDLPELRLRPFDAGARVRIDGKWHTVTDPTRPSSLGGLLGTAAAPVGFLGDKLKVRALREELICASPAAIWEEPETTSIQFLRSRNFSDAMIERFFRPFYGGIFLERELASSSRLLRFSFSQFARGSATLPRGGMAAIPRQLAARLEREQIRLRQAVRAVEPGRVTLDDGQVLKTAAVIVAVDARAAGRLLPELPEVPTRGCTTLTYTARGRGSKLLHLNGSGRGLVNHVAFPSAVQPGYAPDGGLLVTATVLDEADPDELARPVANELRNWFPQLQALRPLYAERLVEALPQMTPGSPVPLRFEPRPGLHLAGDFTRHPSIEGALQSGIDAARKVLRQESSRR